MTDINEIMYTDIEGKLFKRTGEGLCDYSGDGTSLYSNRHIDDLVRIPSDRQALAEETFNNNRRKKKEADEILKRKAEAIAKERWAINKWLS